MTRRAKNTNDDFETREERLRESLKEQTERSIALRSKDREFHGLEREFRYHQEQMIVDFSKSKDIKHPRDVGNVREKILRNFLTTSGFLPKRYTVSSSSIRVASPTGHLSNEIDIALYDAEDSLSLMNREDIFEVLPIESVYGVIQVKSRLNREEIRNGLANLASFKRLDRQIGDQGGNILGAPKERRGFGILFAYDSDLKWQEIYQEIESFAQLHPQTEWANAICILNRGWFVHGSSTMSSALNSHIEAIEELQIHGMPDRQGTALYAFYDVLLTLLRSTTIYPAEWRQYYRLPLTAGKYSYSYYMMHFSEMGRCEKHGDYARKIEPEKLEKVINWCQTTTPINWIKAHNIAYNQPEDEAAYARQPMDVHIYNPDNLPLSEILVQDDTLDGQQIKSLAYDWIISDNMNIWIPYHYTISELIVSICPQCLVGIMKKAGRDAQPKKVRIRRKSITGNTQTVKKEASPKKASTKT
ncbi:hypothetical protein AA14337_2550 [Acetobacter malorum DSM 14337]|uniref:DUF6602 domain-containing protein n=1 Tax=Acetobacter malorum DSM 14337 TaxID=1307910 RepID=A0ABQ0PWB8_9PROT|nr:DUF6602 domain-containing protein [Acetobacter malorum]GBQ83272.1 hypothetical protein AA14337_2550 [Acetobacter malorum DSM 14337]